LSQAPSLTARQLADQYGARASERAGSELLAASAEGNARGVLFWTAVIQELGHAPEPKTPTTVALAPTTTPEFDPLEPGHIAMMLKGRYGQAAESIAARHARDLRARGAEEEAETWDRARQIIEEGH
jgi:hypothetical protein